MANLFQSLRWAHIAAGSIALIVFWIPIFARKGGRNHVRAGWIYVALMSVVVLTAFVMSGLIFTMPVAIRRTNQSVPGGELGVFLRNQRVFATFLAYLAAVTLASGWQGIWAVETRRDSGKMRTPFSLALNAAIVLGGGIVLGLGLRYGKGPLIGMSPIGPVMGAINLRYLLRGPRERMHWWYVHLGSMIGTGIAGYTAFVVFGGAQLFPFIFKTQLRTIFWLFPTMIGVPAIFFWIASYRRQFARPTGQAAAI